MKFECKECDFKTDNKRSFHSHLKAHAVCIGEYYSKHLDRRDKLTFEKIPFINYDQYMKADFIKHENFKTWIKTVDLEYQKEYLLTTAKREFDRKQPRLSPPNLFYTLSELGEIEDYRRAFGSYCGFLDQVGLDKWFHKKLPAGFWEKDCSDLEILVDTREQHPLEFKNSISSKLDFGDYTVSGEKYSATFIDRKSMGDFCSTFSGGIERFRREMERCIEFNSYMFVVVEDSLDGTRKHGKTFSKNSSFIWHNVKQLMLDYPENIQFIFAQSRKGAEKITPKILDAGKDLWNVDLQYFLEQRIKQHVG
ncbi:hypothetical protein N9955_00755 [bacterium]|nr:hypothetical protein [bacterium]